MIKNTLIKTTVLSALALIAFAANSVLCRLALGEHAIDAASFTNIRLLTGAAVLLIIISFNKNNAKSDERGSWSASFMLFIYALAFSYAYTTLSTASGALILFGSVQLSMVLFSLLSGNRLHVSELIGMTIAFSGFVYLIAPDINTPSATGFGLMTIAGIAWGLYTLKASRL